MLSETLEEKLAAEKTLATVVEANTKFRKSYEGMISSPEERALYSEWSKKSEEYKKGTQESVAAIREIGGSIARLSEIASAIAAAVEEQGAATQEIARNVQQAAQGTQQVSSNITDVQRGASETGSASSQVLSAAQMLSRDSNRPKLEVGKFLDSVRAA